MPYILPFFAGCAVSGILTLNYTYENERIKQTLNREISTLQKINNHTEVAKFRRYDWEQRRFVESQSVTIDKGLDSLKDHYKYMNSCTVNAIRECFFSFTLTPYIRAARDQMRAVYRSSTAQADP